MLIKNTNNKNSSIINNKLETIKILLTNFSGLNNALKKNEVHHFTNLNIKSTWCDIWHIKYKLYPKKLLEFILEALSSFLVSCSCKNLKGRQNTQNSHKRDGKVSSTILCLMHYRKLLLFRNCFSDNMCVIYVWMFWNIM